ncbi:threonine-phosphate decarboxylase CobD [Metabacillus iocasae]|uniref:threonine-phosphate decarboxylase n=1 Tax=Priestia iocasae TaxID=2291674 RepID=A0ABS2QRG2_9BACI|nr:threonine-phosphate decarboxylase CobD [Metabacillus iocasae]MBM7701990.1 threonine-phosphate decarboxylase [Metabacillus iocasae]
MRLPSHGANPQKLLRALHTPQQANLLDFSVNTNPLGMPSSFEYWWKDVKKDAFMYPDPEVTELTEKIAFHLNVPLQEVLVTNGAAEAFFLIASLFSHKKVGIIEPTFVEYEQASYAYECEVTKIQLDETNGWQWSIQQVLPFIENVDLLWICHPNNPTGVMYSQSEWEQVLKKAKDHNTVIVIDEAFIDFVEQAVSFVPFIKKGYPVIIVRSMTKMYSIAGIRLGYTLASKTLIQKLKEKQPHWSVNGIAQQIGIACLDEEAFVKETISVVSKERNWVFAQLDTLHLTYSPSVTNYYLCKIPDGWKGREWLMYLASEGIVARHTENFNGLDGRYIRLAIKTRSENEKLIDVIKKGLQIKC